MVSEAVILAGGLGTRMLPASLYSAKEALPLIDTPILNHLVWECAKANVKRVHIVLSQRKMDLLDVFLRGESLCYDEVRRFGPSEGFFGTWNRRNGSNSPRPVESWSGLQTLYPLHWRISNQNSWSF